MVANNTLETGKSDKRQVLVSQHNILLGIIRRICKKSGEYAAHYTIWTRDHEAMVICFNKLVVEYESEDTVHEFATTVCEDICRWPFAS